MKFSKIVVSAFLLFCLSYPVASFSSENEVTELAVLDMGGGKEISVLCIDGIKWLMASKNSGAIDLEPMIAGNGSYLRCTNK